MTHYDVDSMMLAKIWKAHKHWAQEQVSASQLCRIVWIVWLKGSLIRLIRKFDTKKNASILTSGLCFDCFGAQCKLRIGSIWSSIYLNRFCMILNQFMAISQQSSEFRSSWMQFAVLPAAVMFIISKENDLGWNTVFWKVINVYQK